MTNPTSIAKGTGILRLTAATALATVGFAAAVMALPSGAYAYSAKDPGNSIGTVGCTNRTYYVTSAKDAQNCIEDFTSTTNNPARETKVTVSLSTDWNIKDAGHFVIPKGCELTFNLNGHMIDRGLAGTKDGDAWWGTGDGDAFYVEKNATLTINGGSTSIRHLGYLSDYNRFWKSDSKGYSPIYGGLITGCANDDVSAGGAITADGEKAKVYLNDVTLAGNVHDEYGLEHADGGAVYLGGSQSTLKLDNADIIYNHAEGYGGGICVWGNDCSLLIQGASHVDSNHATLSGGGISHNGKRGNVYIGEKSSVDSNFAEEKGGGVYSSYNGTEFTVRDSSVSYNEAASADPEIYGAYKPHMGGGFFLDDVASLSIEKGSVIGYNTADEGGGIYTNDDDTTVSLTGRSSIESNTAKGNGGGVYLNDDDNVVTLDVESSIKNNSAGMWGGGVFGTSSSIMGGFDQSIELKGGSSISGNKASVAGGGVSFTSSTIYGDFSISSPDATGFISGNTSSGAAGVSCGGDTVLDNVSITGNTATGSAGGVAYSENDLTLKGTIKITDNYAAGTASNLVVSDPIEVDDSKPVSASSRIGVTAQGNSKEEMWVTETGFLKDIGDNYLDVVVSDDLKRSITKQDNRLRLVNKASTPALSVYGASDSPTYLRPAYDSTVTLDSSKYKKDGYVIDYWTISNDINGGKLTVDADGKASFKMPGKDVTVRAHYVPALMALELTVREDASWKTLGEDPEGDSFIDAARLTGISGTGHGFCTTEEIRKALKVTDAVVEDTQDGGKKVTYTIEMSKVALDSFGMAYVQGQLKTATAEVRSGFGRASDNAVKVAADAEGNLTITATFALTNSNATVTVSAIDQNKASSGAFDTVVDDVSTLEVVSASTGVKAMSSDDTVSITAPDEPGWSFDHWEDLPDGVTLDSTGVSTLIKRKNASSANLTAVYKPLASAVSISMKDLTPGEAFPTTVDNVLVAGAKELDISSYVKDAVKVTWTKADGSAVGDTVEGDTDYVATIVTDGDAVPASFGFDEGVYTTVNGTEAASTVYAGDSAKQKVTYEVHSASDTRYDGMLFDYVTAGIYYAGDLSDDLPVNAYYKLKNGDILTAPITWDTSGVDASQTSGYIYVPGVFTDKYGDEHELTYTFSFIDLGAPEATYTAKNDGTGTQLVTLGKGLGWMGQVEHTIYYQVVDYSSLDGTAIDRSVFSVYKEGDQIELHEGQIIMAYAVVEVHSGVQRDTGLEFYGRSLEFADVSVSSANVADGDAIPDIKVTLDGKELTAGQDYQVNYSHNSGVGEAFAYITGNYSTFSGSQFASYDVTPNKVTGVAARKAGKGKAKVTWSKHKAQTSGFQVRYATSKAKLAKNKGKAVKVTGAAKKVYTAKSLKSGKKYFFKVRAYKKVGTKTYWSGWSKVVSVKVK